MSALTKHKKQLNTPKETYDLFVSYKIKPRGDEPLLKELTYKNYRILFWKRVIKTNVDLNTRLRFCMNYIHERVHKIEAKNVMYHIVKTSLVNDPMDILKERFKDEFRNKNKNENEK